MIARLFVFFLIFISCAVLALSIPFFIPVRFPPSTSLQDAYAQHGPGYYAWRVEFSPGDTLRGGIDLYSEPEDWQKVYDREWQRVDNLISRRDDIQFVPYWPGCWEWHNCPPMDADRFDPPALTVSEALADWLWR